MKRIKIKRKFESCRRRDSNSLDPTFHSPAQKQNRIFVGPNPNQIVTPFSTTTSCLIHTTSNHATLTVYDKSQDRFKAIVSDDQDMGFVLQQEPEYLNLESDQTWYGNMISSSSSSSSSPDSITNPVEEGLDPLLNDLQEAQYETFHFSSTVLSSGTFDRKDMFRFHEDPTLTDYCVYEPRSIEEMVRYPCMLCPIDHLVLA